MVKEKELEVEQEKEVEMVEEMDAEVVEVKKEERKVELFDERNEWSGCSMKTIRRWRRKRRKSRRRGREQKFGGDL